MASQKDRMPEAFAYNIYLMLAMPALILGGFAGAFYRMYRKSRCAGLSQERGQGQE